MWRCIIAHESGGDPRAVEPRGVPDGHGGIQHAGGLFQLLPSTAAGLGFPAHQQFQPVSEQIAAATKLYLQSGFMPWTSDGCVR